MVRRVIRRRRRSMGRRRMVRRRRSIRSRMPRNSIGSTYDGAYKAKCTLNGDMLNSSAASGAQLLVSWGQNKTVATLGDPYTTPEFIALASRFQEYCIVGFKVTFIPAY